MLLSARIAGRREHRGVFTATAVWEPIIDLETHERLRRVLSDPHRLTNGGTSRRSYLLTGIAECALCGARLVARPRPTYRSYVCTRGPGLGGCGKIRVKAEPLEELVAEAIFAALDSPAFAAALRETDEPDGLAEAVAQDEAALEQLAVDHYSEKIIGRAEYLAARSAIQVRLDANRRTLAHRTGSDLLGVPSGAEAVRAAWNANDIVWRRALVRTVLESVSVGSAVPGRRRFDPGRVRLAWRA
jgi:hypothetical protein